MTPCLFEDSEDRRCRCILIRRGSHRPMSSDAVTRGELKRIDRSQLLRLNEIAVLSGFSGKRSQEWIDSKIQLQDNLVIRPLLWEDSPSRCLRCGVIFVNRENGLGQMLLDLHEEAFEQLPSVRSSEIHGLALWLLDHVKILEPTLPGERQ
jgi:hypothetical protein